jgi:hypothetical protein
MRKLWMSAFILMASLLNSQDIFQYKFYNSVYAVIRMRDRTNPTLVSTTEAMLRSYAAKTLLIDDPSEVDDLQKVLIKAKKSHSTYYPSDLIAVIEIHQYDKVLVYLVSPFSFVLKGADDIYETPEGFLDNYWE